MSDVFQGPGWWMASDGKWYAPERHPDANYRNQFAVPAEPAEFPAVGLHGEQPTETTATSTFTEMVVSRSAQLDETAEISGQDLAAELELVEQQRRQAAQRAAAQSVGLHQVTTTSQPPATETTPAQNPVVPSEPAIGRQPEAAETTPIQTPAVESPQHVDPAVPQEDVTEPQPPEQPSAVQRETSLAPKRPIPSETPERPTQVFSVASPDFVNPPTRPIFDTAAPASVVAAPGRPQSLPGRTELEVDATSPTGMSLSAAPVTASPSTRPSTALVHLPGPPLEVASTKDRVLASLIFVSGIAMIIGTFLEWTTAPVAETGWMRGDGIATVLAGVLGSAMAGPIFVGFRHVIPKATAIVAGLVGIVVVGLAAIGGDGLGLGFYVEIVAALVMVLAAVADQGDAPA